MAIHDSDRAKRCNACGHAKYWHEIGNRNMPMDWVESQDRCKGELEEGCDCDGFTQLVQAGSWSINVRTDPMMPPGVALIGSAVRPDVSECERHECAGFTLDLEDAMSVVLDAFPGCALRWALAQAKRMLKDPDYYAAMAERAEWQRGSDDPYGYVEDGWNAWPRCNTDCQLQVVRPGKVQCDCGREPSSCEDDL